LRRERAEGGEGFLLGVGGDGADGSAEHLRLQQLQGFEELLTAEQAGFMVGVELQQQGVHHVHLELPQVEERLVEGGVRFLAQGNTALADGDGLEIAQ